jgi:hypothetical protein
MMADHLHGAGVKTGRERRTSRVRLLLSLLLWLPLIGFGARPAAAAPTTAQVTNAGPGPQSAIADFDGDLRLDSAVIEPGAVVSGGIHYSIQLHLSDTRGHSLQLVAPAGGLVIEARDVNGDHAVDLVLSTAWSRHPVAVFLNDGHGSFSRSETGLASDLISSSGTRFSPTGRVPCDSVGVPPQSDDSPCAMESDAIFHVASTRLIGTATERILANASLLSRPGRAPPLMLS